LFCLEKSRLRGDLISMFQYLKDGYEEDREKGCHMEKTKGNRYKLCLGRF